MLRVVLQFTKLDAMRYISHLDFQRLWNRLFRIAGIQVEHSRGFNPHPRIRFAVPLATGFRSKSELLEVYLKESMPMRDILAALSKIVPEGLDILAVTQVPEGFPKLTALVDALEYKVELPDREEVILRKAGDEVETKAGTLLLSEYLAAMDVDGSSWRLLIKAENQKTLRPDLVARHFFPEFDAVQFHITRTAIYTRTQNLQPVPRGLSILFD